jgi:hypothetical protein
VQCNFVFQENERFYVYFSNHHEYELTADSLEDKNKIFNLLNQIIEENSIGFEDDSDEEVGSAASAQQDVLKQGQLEKRGHSAAYFTWAKRWIKIVSGSLSYYKMDDFHNALNSIQLGAGFSTIQKVDHNGFSVSTKTKTFHFRVPNPNNARPHSAVIAERDKWFETLTAAVMPSKQRPVSIGQEIELDSESQDPSIMFKMLSRELKSLSQSLSHIEGSTFAVAQVRKLQQMTKAIQHRTSLRNTTTKPPNTPPVMYVADGLIVLLYERSVGQAPFTSC